MVEGGSTLAPWKCFGGGGCITQGHVSAATSCSHKKMQLALYYMNSTSTNYLKKSPQRSATVPALSHNNYSNFKGLSHDHQVITYSLSSVTLKFVGKKQKEKFIFSFNLLKLCISLNRN